MTLSDVLPLPLAVGGGLPDVLDDGGEALAEALTDGEGVTAVDAVDEALREALVLPLLLLLALGLGEKEKEGELEEEPCR